MRESQKLFVVALFIVVCLQCCTGGALESNATDTGSGIVCALGEKPKTGGTSGQQWCAVAGSGKDTGWTAPCSATKHQGCEKVKDWSDVAKGIRDGPDRNSNVWNYGGGLPLISDFLMPFYTWKTLDDKNNFSWQDKDGNLKQCGITGPGITVLDGNNTDTQSPPPAPSGAKNNLENIETLFIVQHGLDKSGGQTGPESVETKGQNILGSIWDAIANENGGFPALENGKFYVIAPVFADAGTLKDLSKPSSKSPFKTPPGVSSSGNLLDWGADIEWVSGVEGITCGGKKPCTQKEGGVPPDDPETIKVGPSSYEVYDDMIDFFTDKSNDCMPNLKRIVLVGFSAGAQFIDRYSLVSPLFTDIETTRNIATDVFIGAPASTSYFDNIRPRLARNYGFDSIGGPKSCRAQGFGDYLKCRGKDPDTGADVGSCDMDAYYQCVTGEPYEFEKYEDMVCYDKYHSNPKGPTVADADCNRVSKESTEWWAWPWGKLPSKTAPCTESSKCFEPKVKNDKGMTYFESGYRASPESIRDYHKRFNERHVVWLVGSNDQMGAMGNRDNRCALEIQGDSHLQKVLVNFENVQRLSPGAANDHDLYVLQGPRHVYHDVFNHDGIRACLVNGDCKNKCNVPYENGNNYHPSPNTVQTLSNYCVQLKALDASCPPGPLPQVNETTSN